MTKDENSVLLPPMKLFFLRSSLLILFLSLAVSCSPQAAQTDGDDADVRAFLTRYFSTWSAKDISGYASCFHEQARISFVHQGQPRTEGLTDFIHSQKLSHATTSEPMTEVPTDMKILRDERTAQASVRWKLTKGAEITTGTDCFTLIKTPAGWKIISLVFYND